MSDNIYGQNIYSHKEEMWHKKGTVGQDDERAEEVYGRMTPVIFEQRPFSITLGGQSVESGDLGIVRTSDTEVLVGITKGRYNLTQPLTYCQMFDANVQQPVETLGFLGTKADKMFLTWKLPKIDVHGDKVENFGFIATGFDGRFGEHLFVTHVRVVCNNTWNAAIGDGKSALYNGKHSDTNHERNLALWMEFVQRDAEEHVMIYQKLFRKLEEVSVSKDNARTIFENVYPYTGDGMTYGPQVLIDEGAKRDQEFNMKQGESRNLAMELFCGKGTEINTTAWGVFNAVTEAENHCKKSKKDTTASILLGSRAAIMDRAMAVVLDFADHRD